MSQRLPFVKGHGTENDFVLVPDADGALGPLDPATVAALCHRRAGLGGDGVIRVVRTGKADDPAASAAAERAEWFMDYANADGSLSQMCGNGIRVLARYLVERQGVDPGKPFPIATRGGVRTLSIEADGSVTVDMGTPAVLAETTVGVAAAGSAPWPATNVDLGNPHAVAFVESLADAGALVDPPAYDREVYPEGVNVEFVAARGPRHVAMRVFERGSGETRSCGTGACAAMVAAAVRDGECGPGGPGVDLAYRVDVPGGSLGVTWTAAGRVLLTGPAVLVAHGTATLPC